MVYEGRNLLLVLADRDGLDLLRDVGDDVLGGLDGRGDDRLLGLLVGAVGGWGRLLSVELLDVLLGLGNVLG